MAAPIQPPPVPPQLNAVVRALQSGLSNGQTTAAGGLAGTAYYLSQSGFQLPTSKQDWLNFAVGLLLAVLGLLAKNATQGSQPGA